MDQPDKKQGAKGGFNPAPAFVRWIIALPA
jgi:hypothetical protein